MNPLIKQEGYLKKRNGCIDVIILYSILPLHYYMYISMCISTNILFRKNKLALIAFCLPSYILLAKGAALIHLV